MKRCVRSSTWYFAVLVTLALMQVRVQADWVTELNSSNPINWYRFNELSGSTANDEGPGNMDGTYVGGVLLGQAGLADSAAAFNGQGYVLLGGQTLTGNWTLESIFKADTVAGSVSMGLIGTDFGAPAGRTAIKAEQWNETGRMGYTDFGVIDVTFRDPRAATPADFRHVVFVGDMTGVSVYVDGALVDQDATVLGLARWALGTAAVRADGTLSDPLTGVIDELAIYDRALSPAEITAHFNSIGTTPGISDLGNTSLLLGIGLAGTWRLRRRLCQG